jgi:hypothetical protein
MSSPSKSVRNQTEVVGKSSTYNMLRDNFFNFIIAFTVNFHLVFNNQQMHTHKLLYSFINIDAFPYSCFGP